MEEQMEEQVVKPTLPRLFMATFMLSAFTFGGGYVIVAMMQKRFVDKYHWLTKEEMLDLTAIAQSSPGPMACSAAMSAGYRLHGYSGMLVSLLGSILPPFVIICIVSQIYTWIESNLYFSVVMQGMQAGVSAVIADVSISMAWDIFRQKTLLRSIILIAAFLIEVFFGVNIIYIILFCIAFGVIMAVRDYRQDKRKGRANE